MNVQALKDLVPRRDQPLHQYVKDTVVTAIETGHFKPGERINSTQELSRQLEVSVVTVHRALQELVSNGILDRRQGLGTFVVDQNERERQLKQLLRIGVVIRAQAMIGDYYYGQLIEGLRQAANKHRVELTMKHYESDLANPCHAYIHINPMQNEVSYFNSRLKKDLPGVVLSANSEFPNIASVGVDNVDLAKQAVDHLYQMGHRKIAYIGGPLILSDNYDRQKGFLERCKEIKLDVDEEHILLSQKSMLSQEEKTQLNTMFASSNRPTAIFAAGFYFALNAYEVAARLHLKIPQDLSVIGVDDPRSSMYLLPPLTTMRQPLVETGHAALSLLVEYLRGETLQLQNQTLRSDLIIRQSTAAAPNL
ncbi:substrate-binding domain-containing protein [Poriferisphaera sp. WC338]|uniref:substrate-binding domain-containing protein n=1 Tax=Poriferisphaera sp. WC338 TaxID=3425129 RepID=UPI003D813269